MANATVTTLVSRVRRFVGDYPELDVMLSLVQLANQPYCTVTVADSSVYSVNWMIQIDQEMMRVRSIPTSTTFTAWRAQMGSASGTFATNDRILVRPKFSDVQILDALNEAIQATFPFYYLPVTNTSLTADGATYEYTVPNMPDTYSGATMMIPYLYKIDILTAGDNAYRPIERWDLVRGATRKIKFRSPPQPGTMRVHGFGPFPDLDFTSNTALEVGFPVWGEQALVEYASNVLLMSQEAAHRFDAGPRDDRDNALRPGSFAQVANQVLNRFQFRLQAAPMPPLPKHIIRVI